MTMSPQSASGEHDDTVVSWQLPNGCVDVTLCAAHIARVRVTTALPEQSYSYLDLAQWPAVAHRREGNPPSTIATEAMTLSMDDARNDIRVMRPDDTGLFTIPLDAMGVDNCDTPSESSRKASRVKASVIWQGEQHFYGLGEGGKQFDRLDGARQLWNGHFGHGPGSDIGVPLLLSSAGYALFFDTASDARLLLGRSDDGNRIDVEVSAGTLDYYIVVANSLRQVVSDATALLDRPPMPPRWALGYWQSTRHFDRPAEISALAGKLRSARIPCDGLIFLSTYGDAWGWNRGVGYLEWQPDLFPAPAEAMRDLLAEGFQVMLHEYPVVHSESPLYTDAQTRGYLLDDGYEQRPAGQRPSTNFHEGQRYIDFSSTDARIWWWQAHDALRAMGVSAWWLDGGEGPALSTQLSGGRGEALHNLYDRLRQQAFAEGEEQDRPTTRPFLLCRSGAAGMQRFGAACWSGDINNTFATLEAQVALGLNTGLSGIPYWGTDIGGFFHPQPESAELFARWFQFGTFCPIFRAHGWVWREHLPWAHGERIEAICRTYAELRYRLLPYTYSLAWQAHRDGLPLMRPLVLNYPDDPETWELGNEYLWGDDLLVAPVTRQGATAWPVYLPRGQWHNFWDGDMVTGPCGVTVAAPLERLPLFVRGGAILPLAPLAQYDGERPWDAMTLLIYPDGSSQFDLYEDDGTSNAYRAGQAAITTITCVAVGGRVTVTIQPPRGDPALIPPARTYTLYIAGPIPREVMVNAHTMDARAATTIEHDGKAARVHLAAAAGTVVVVY